jgi:hypothetical protein
MTGLEASHSAQQQTIANAITLSGSPRRYRGRIRGRHADTDETRAARFAPGMYPLNLG